MIKVVGVQLNMKKINGETRWLKFAVWKNWLSYEYPGVDWMFI